MLEGDIKLAWFDKENIYYTSRRGNENVSRCHSFCFASNDENWDLNMHNYIAQEIKIFIADIIQYKSEKQLFLLLRFVY